MTLKPKYLLLTLFFALPLAPTASAQEDEGGDETQEEQEKEPAITDYIEMDPRRNRTTFRPSVAAVSSPIVIAFRSAERT